MEADRLDILDKLHKQEANMFFDKYNIKTVLLFGSLLRADDFNEESDVDIAIVSKNKYDLNDILEIELFLEDLLKRNIDVVDLNSENMDIYVKINILNTGKSIYTSDDNKMLDKLIDKVEWYYKENEHFLMCKRRDILS